MGFFFNHQLQLHNVSSRDLGKSHCPCFHFWYSENKYRFIFQQNYRKLCLMFIMYNIHDIYYDRNEKYSRLIDIKCPTVMLAPYPFHHESDHQFPWCYFPICKSVFPPDCTFDGRIYFAGAILEVSCLILVCEADTWYPTRDISSTCKLPDLLG